MYVFTVRSLTPTAAASDEAFTAVDVFIVTSICWQATKALSWLAFVLNAVGTIRAKVRAKVRAKLSEKVCAKAELNLTPSTSVFSSSP